MRGGTRVFSYRNPDGSESEPLQLHALIALARAGVVSEETPIREPGNETWKPAWLVPALQPAFGLMAPPVATELDAKDAERTAEDPDRMPSPPAENSHVVARKRPRNVLLLALAIGVVVSLARILLTATTLTTRDGRMQLTVGSGWTRRQPDPGLELQADTDGGETVLLAGSVETSPAEPPMSLEAFDYSLIQGPASASPDFEDLGTESYTANGLEFLRHDFRGTLNGRSGLFVLVSTKLPGRFYRLVAATSGARAERRRPDLERIVRSFRPSRA